MFPAMAEEEVVTEAMKTKIMEEEAKFGYSIQSDRDGGFTAKQERLKDGS